jgi:hypothetical protein
LSNFFQGIADRIVTQSDGSFVWSRIFLFHGSLRSPLWCGKLRTCLIAINCGLLIILSFYDFHRYRIDFPYGIPVGGFCLFHQTRGQGSCLIVGGHQTQGRIHCCPAVGTSFQTLKPSPVWFFPALMPSPVWFLPALKSSPVWFLPALKPSPVWLR